MFFKCCLLAFGLLFFCGCAEFRAIFDESPQRHEEKVMRRKARQEKVDEHRFHDPLHDMFKVKNDAPILPESDLTPYERQVIDAHRKSNIEDIEAIKREGEKSRRARQEWVFGKNPFN
jgi:hypothetical protein